MTPAEKVMRLELGRDLIILACVLCRELGVVIWLGVVVDVVKKAKN